MKKERENSWRGHVSEINQKVDIERESYNKQRNLSVSLIRSENENCFSD